jgi:dihydroorotase/N-acyl-D-amino-acid deacylase
MNRFLLSLFCVCAAFAQTPYDAILTGGKIVDGTGNAWFYGDVAIRGDRIARIAPAGVLRNTPARERIDVSGLIVAPGFFDIQSHSRAAFLSEDGRVISKVTQGVTTEIMGEGWTNAPSNEKTRAGERDTGRATNDPFEGPHGFDAWLKAMKAHGTSGSM